MLSPLTHIPAHVVSLDDYALLARERMEADVWAYLSGGAADELTVLQNRKSYHKLCIVPRVLRDMREATTALSLLDKNYPHPIFVAPTAYHHLFHTEGELGTAMGTAAFGAGMIVSTQASTLLEDIAAGARAPLWFQLYIQPDREFTLDLVKRAEAAGYEALVLTVDAPLSGIRNREQRAGFQLPPGVEAVNLRGMVSLAAQDRIFGNDLLAAAPTWKDIEWLQSHTRLPLFLKGILSPDDASLALEHQVAGIIVSNHGGRTLDGVPATIDVLPSIAREVAGRVPVLVDGGIRRGTDIFKAIARGADAVMVGRPILHGLAVAGAVGVAHVLKILRTELETTMALAGCASLSEIRRPGAVIPFG